MKFPTKILFPTDFSPIAKNAFEYALHLANILESDIEVLHVYSDVVGVPSSDAIAFSVLHGRQKEAQHYLDNFIGFKANVSPQIADNVAVSTKLESGVLLDFVAEATQKKEYGLVVMGTHKEHTWVESMLGSVSSSVVSYANCPVLVVPEHYQFAPIANIGFTTDLREYNLEGVLEAVALARQLGAALHCIHVATNADTKHSDLLDLDSFLQIHTKGVPYQIFDIEADSIAQGVERCIHEEKIDLLLMVRPQRSFLQKVFHHSQTKELLLKPKVPVWILKQ